MVDTLRHVPRIHRLVATAALLLVTSAHAAGEAVAAVPAPAAAASAPTVQRIEDFGVELVGVRLSGADFLIDVRYRVKDTAKAQALLERKIHPVLVNEATGDRFYIPQVPKVGSLAPVGDGQAAGAAGQGLFHAVCQPGPQAPRRREGDTPCRRFDGQGPRGPVGGVAALSAALLCSSAAARRPASTPSSPRAWRATRARSAIR